MVIVGVVGGDERRARLARRARRARPGGGARCRRRRRWRRDRRGRARRPTACARRSAKSGVIRRGGRAMKIWPSLAAIISSKEKWHWPLMARRLPAVSRRHSAAVGRAVGRIAGRLEAVGGDEPRADQQADLVLLGRPMRPHHAGQRIAVGDADGGKPQLRRLLRPSRARARPRAGTRSWWRRPARRRGSCDVIPALVPGIQPSTCAARWECATPLPHGV